MSVRTFKYFSPLILYTAALQSFHSYGFTCYIPLIYSWIIIPVVELLVPQDSTNLSEAEEQFAKADPVYDYLLYIIVLLQLSGLISFLYSMQDPLLNWVDRVGRIGTMGLLCGTFGINVGHELGHRTKKFEKIFAKISLLTSLYMHFYIEHNKGHHKHVGTPQDPSSAHYGEPVYTFWFRSIVFSYLHALRIANDEMKKKGKRAISWYNPMLHFLLVEVAFLSVIFLLFGIIILCYFLIAAFIGILLLETVNYIEHYGLTRKEIAHGKFERAMPQHSWNSNHIIGRVMLFELSRHSDHHYLANRKYQLLRHHEDAPQMPTGYPGMMILSLFPPLWFQVMNKRVNQITSGTIVIPVKPQEPVTETAQI